MPSSSGICRSSSGDVGPGGHRLADRLARRWPPRPPPRCPGSEPSSAGSPARTTGWSSATSDADASRRAQRERRADPAAACRDGPASSVPPSSAARSRIDGEPDPGRHARAAAAVVGHLDVQRRRAAERDHGRGRVGVPGDVGQRLGGDPVRRHLDRGGQRRAARRATSRTASRAAVAAARQLLGALPERPTRPSSSSAGGRSSSTSRRTSAMACRACRRRDRPAARGALRVVVEEVRGRVRGQRQPVSAGPSPSCRSRRSRRRSSSRAATSRSREACSSAESRGGVTATASGAATSCERRRRPSGSAPLAAAQPDHELAHIGAGVRQREAATCPGRGVAVLGQQSCVRRRTAT